MFGASRCRFIDSSPIYPRLAHLAPRFFYSVVGEDHEALEAMMYQLQESYKVGVGEQYLIPPLMIKEGLICAAKYEEDWHR